MWLPKTLFSYSNVSKCVILYLSQGTGHRSVVTCNINVVFTRSPLNCLSLLSKLASLSWEKKVRIKTNRRHLNKRWEKGFSLRWVRLILIIKCCMMLSLNTNRSLLKVATETSTTKARNMRLEWRTTSLGGCLLPYVSLLEFRRTHPHHGCITCRDMDLLQLTKTWKYQALTLSFLRAWMAATIYKPV